MTVRVTVPVNGWVLAAVGATTTEIGIPSMLPLAPTVIVVVVAANVGATPVLFTPTGVLATSP